MTDKMITDAADAAKQDSINEQAISDASGSFQDAAAVAKEENDNSDNAPKGTFKSCGDDESELSRLQALGLSAMSESERAEFKELAQRKSLQMRERELVDAGVPSSVSESREFRDFCDKFTHGTPIGEIYDIYLRASRGGGNIRPMGSMKSSSRSDGVKDFYSADEARRFTRKEINDNPALYRAILSSMKKW